MPTEKELEELQARLAKKRDQIAAEEAKRAERQGEQEREIRFAQLQAEEARLDAELNRAKQLSKVAGSKEAASTVLESAQAQLEHARVLAEAPAGPVDTNAENPPKDTGATKAVEGGVTKTASDGVVTVERPTEKNGGNN